MSKKHDFKRASKSGTICKLTVKKANVKCLYAKKGKIHKLHAHDMSVHDMSVHDDLSVHNNVDIGGELNVAKKATFNDVCINHDLTVGNDVHIKHDLEVDGNTHLQEVETKNLTVDCNLVSRKKLFVGYPNPVDNGFDASINTMLYVSDKIVVGDNTSVTGLETENETLQVRGTTFTKHLKVADQQMMLIVSDLGILLPNIPHVSNINEPGYIGSAESGTVYADQDNYLKIVP